MLSSDRLNRIGDLYLRLADALERVLWAVSVGIFILIISILLGGVISRQLGFGAPVWYGEIQRYLGMWATLLLAGPLVYRDNHFNVKMIHSYVGKKMRYYLILFKHVPILFVGMVLWNWGAEYVLGAGMASTASSMNFRMAWVYLVLPITGLLIMFFSVARLITLIREGRTITSDYETLAEEIDQESAVSTSGK